MGASQNRKYFFLQIWVPPNGANIFVKKVMISVKKVVISVKKVTKNLLRTTLFFLVTFFTKLGASHFGNVKKCKKGVPPGIRREAPLLKLFRRGASREAPPRSRFERGASREAGFGCPRVSDICRAAALGLLLGCLNVSDRLP